MNEAVAVGVVFGVVGIATAMVVGLAVQENDKWQDFKVAHNCVVTSHVPSTTTMGWSYGYHFINGKYQYGYGFGPVTTPESNVYHCDDNQDYTR